MSAPENSPPENLKLIRLNSHRIDEPDTTWATTYPYKLEANFKPPEFMQAAFICLYGGSEELVVRGKTREALDRFITQNNLTKHPRLHRMLITDPDGNTAEIRR